MILNNWIPFIFILEVQPRPAPDFLVQPPGLHILTVARPVHSPLLHGDEVVRPGRQQHRVDYQTVGVVLHAEDNYQD